MRKLKLDLEALSVESFDTTPEARREGGTVFGQNHCTCQTECTCPGCPTCDASCNGSCDASCDGTCDATCETWGATCDASCYYQVGASCHNTCYEPTCYNCSFNGYGCGTM